MREFIINNLASEQTLSISVIILNNIVAIVSSLFIMFTYKNTYSGTAYSKKFNVSTGAITIITAMIMSIISNNIALSLGMVGALSIIRFRTAVKDVRDAAFIFWAIAAGIGCGVSQYALVAVGSVTLLCFFLITGLFVSNGRQLLVVQGSASAQNELETIVSEHFKGKAHLTAKSVTENSCELVYSVGEGVLKRADERNQIDIVQRLMKVEGAKRANIVEQQDDIAR